MNQYEKVFSHNIRKYRKLHGLTQKMLAEATGYSEKAVSKWETDGSIPPIESLFLIADVFQIDLNTLFQGDETMYFLGIDGGGTKTAFALADYTGAIHRRLFLDSCNPYDVGIERTKEVLKNGINQICKGIPFSSIVVFIGIPGSKISSYYESLLQFLQDFHFVCANVGSDNENIIAAGLDGRDGITLILGTGVCSYVVKGDTYHRIAGWGYLFDEGGSAYNIGRDAISRYFSVCDGSIEKNSLSDRIHAIADEDPAVLLNTLYEGGKKVIATYAKLVFEEAERGDSVSRAILRRNMEEAARIIHTARTHFPKDITVPVILAGVLTEQSLLLPMLNEALVNINGLQIEILSVPPVEGAIKKAKELWYQGK